MKRLKYLLLIITIVAFIGCSDDDDDNTKLTINIEETTTNSIKLSWNKIDKAKFYTYMVEKDGVDISVDVIAETSVTISNLESETEYTITIAAGITLEDETPLDMKILKITTK